MRTSRSAARKVRARADRAPTARRSPATTTTDTSHMAAATGASGEPRYPVAHAPLAAERAVQRTSVSIQLPVIGTIHLPSREELLFVGGLSGLAAVGLLEWPVACF